MSADTGPQTRVVAGRYALGEVLGQGGMGTVWLATDRVLERQVAVKEVTFPLHVTEEERAILRERTMREARAAGRLEHPHVTTVYDVVEEGGKPWLVMKHVAARSLQEVIEERGPLPPAEVARIGLHVLDALGAAHALGIVHRDVKPANVLVGPDGSGCLTDFGIATTTGDSSLTTNGALIGSPSYMAPERAHGDEPRPPVDLWSLGATLYAAVEGRPPFDGGESMATLMSVVSEPPAPMLRAGPLEPVLRGLLTKDPAQRSTAAIARSQLAAVAAGNASAPKAPAPAPPPPPSSPGPIPGGTAERIDAADLLALASASRALLGSVARDARDQARHIRGTRRERKESRPVVKPAPPVPPARSKSRFRFKRRWVVVPVVTTLLVLLVLLVGAALAIGAFFD
ncbi:Serine/threonine protein kinase [Blastococcus aurantiacus]|uniref:non-specific serine/threonine protein kinase n=1 Tax=Blastococcus aurantiacus TaxID=1550231 RepID=A0A1G7LQ32_9ACTN|nr:serine/threonine-protein kinase [Blastococcus aurantiacus]SDF51511.1 Serine/threonine protein kinase [Blastococcus aurantiacus]